MTTVRNTGNEPVWFRDDAGKHQLDPGQVIEVQGDQHLAHALSLDGVVEVAEDDAPRGDQEAPATPDDICGWLTDRGIAVPDQATKAELEALYLESSHEGGKVSADDPVATSTGEAGRRPKAKA